MSPDRRIEELLVRVAAGELASDAPELQALLADPAAREAAEEWLATAAALTALGRAEAADRGQAGPPEHADLARARDFLRARAARPRARRIAPLWIGAAAAAALLALWLLLGPLRHEVREPLTLGQGGIELLEPDAGWRAFRWRPLVAPPPLARFSVVIEARGRELLRIEGLEQPAFEPDAAALEMLAGFDELRWKVVLTSGDGSQSVLAWGTADSSQR